MYGKAGRGGRRAGGAVVRQVGQSSIRCSGRPAGAKIPFFRISHLVSAGLAENQGRHDSAGCGNEKILVSAPGCLNTKLLHCNYFTRIGHIVYNRRMIRLFCRQSQLSPGGSIGSSVIFCLTHPQIGTICLRRQVRKSVFSQNCTFGSGGNILIKFFCQIRTLETAFWGAIRAHLGNSAPVPYSIHAKAACGSPVRT